MSTRSKESFLRQLSKKALTKINTGETPVDEENNTITLPIELYCELYGRINQLEAAVKARKKR